MNQILYLLDRRTLSMKAYCAVLSLRLMYGISYPFPLHGCISFRPKKIHVNECQEEKTPQEKIDVKELVEATGNIVGNHLGHRKGQTKDDQDLAIQR